MKAQKSKDTERAVLTIPSTILTVEGRNEYIYKTLIEGDSAKAKQLKRNIFKRAFRYTLNKQEAEDAMQEVATPFVNKFEIRTLDLEHLRGQVFNWHDQALKNWSSNRNRSKGNQDFRKDPSMEELMSYNSSRQTDILLCIQYSEVLDIAVDLHPTISKASENWEKEIVDAINHDAEFREELRIEIEEKHPHLVY